MRTLVWFRGKDLRIHDHLPLQDAAEFGEVIPIFVLDPYFFGVEKAKKIGHRIQFLLESLVELSSNLHNLGSELIVIQGRSIKVIPQLAERWKVDRVVAHRWVEPFAKKRDQIVQQRLHVPLHLYEGETLAPLDCVLNSQGEPYRVYSPFARKFLQTVTPAAPHPLIRQLPPLPSDIQFDPTAIPNCRELQISENRNLIRGGESAAKQRLKQFLEKLLHEYEHGRNELEPISSSQMSADLKFGLISVRSVWHLVSNSSESQIDRERFLRQLLWREFSHYTLWHWPSVLEHSFSPKFEDFPWRTDSKVQSELQAWKLGHTGYPIIDAAARQLLQTGFMCNRTRMISASFLCKHLRIHYRHGEDHFHRHLVDGDWAQNNFGWQWAAGTGCDAQSYFRIFNPVAQGRKFDPEGAYIRRYIPELAKLPNAYIHRPWKATSKVLEDTGVQLGTDYPHVLVDHKNACATYLATARSHVGMQATVTPNGVDI